MKLIIVGQRNGRVRRCFLVVMRFIILPRYKSVLPFVYFHKSLKHKMEYMKYVFPSRAFYHCTILSLKKTFPPDISAPSAIQTSDIFSVANRLSVRDVRAASRRRHQRFAVHSFLLLSQGAETPEGCCQSASSINFLRLFLAFLRDAF